MGKVSFNGIELICGEDGASCILFQEEQLFSGSLKRNRKERPFAIEKLTTRIQNGLDIIVEENQVDQEKGWRMYQRMKARVEKE